MPTEPKRGRLSTAQAAHIARRFCRPAAKPTFNWSDVDTNGIGAGTNSLGLSSVSIPDPPDNAADTAIYRAGFTPTNDKNG